MAERELRELRERLHVELARADPDDPESSAILREIHDELTEALEREELDPPTLRDRLRSRLRDLERSHPDLVAGVDNVLRALANVGF
jgi:DNA-binding TFAR19-related protein (PDSD5 family)